MPSTPWGWFYRVATLTAAWGVVLLGLGVYLDACVSVYEPLTRRVDTWSFTGGVRHVAPLPRAYELLTPTRFADGRIFLTAQDRYASPSARTVLQWDAKSERFDPTGALPARTPPPGVDVTGKRVTYSPFGRVLVTPQAGPGRDMVFDQGWREIGPMPTSFGDYIAVDLTNGGLLVIDEWDTNGRWAALLDPGATQWRPVSPPLIEGRAYFTGPDGKVALLDEPAVRLWDPGSGAVETLPGPNAMRVGAAAVSIDEGHLLIAGGQSVDKIRNPPFLLACASTVAWLALGAYGAVRLLRTTRATRQPAEVRRYAMAGLGAGMVPAVVLLVVVLVGAVLLRTLQFRAN